MLFCNIELKIYVPDGFGGEWTLFVSLCLLSSENEPFICFIGEKKKVS